VTTISRVRIQEQGLFLITDPTSRQVDLFDTDAKQIETTDMQKTVVAVVDQPHHIFRYEHRITSIEAINDKLIIMLEYTMG
jgi:virulence-associated protein VagC